MSKGQNKSTALKVHPQDINNDRRSTSEQAAEEIKDSDADMDQGEAFDDQVTVQEAEKQIRGSDADSA
ncbi:hypothetical protein QG516_03295 [Pedobacter gandavensis]|uniref:hypothetical protein n=1 Tax=Pedobacter gandavensis TaxID=2679963 RepID=UPI002478DA84|nr:hypothetical protein [Pedobacter gandavensis]WGQ10679.1 hypothetical protein QG516_03295 [Pedobacter gandavensis]